MIAERGSPRAADDATPRGEMLRAAADLARQGRWEDAMRVRIEVAASWPEPISVTLSPSPWSRMGWTGRLISLDGCDTEDFTIDDVARVIGCGGYGDPCDCDLGDHDYNWDDTVAGIAQLEDGRFVAWETTVDATGNGFQYDEYGGDADIWFARTPGACLEKLSERARELLRWS